MSVKSLKAFGLGLMGLAATNVWAGHAPQGHLIELHSCEVYAGGCVVSSEATQSGHYMVQVWDVTSGAWHGVDLSGLRVALLELSPENLAVATTPAAQAVVYLPETAHREQRTALVAWLKSREPELQRAELQSRTVPISFRSTAGEVAFRAGQFIQLQVASAGPCENRVCGEDLWYAPRVPTLAFTVGENAGSQVNEPFLQLKWDDHGKRSVFLARFGGSDVAKNLFVQSCDWCSPTGPLF